MKNLNRTVTTSIGQSYAHAPKRGVIEDIIAALTGTRPVK